MPNHRMAWHPDLSGGGCLRCIHCGISGVFSNWTSCPASREVVQPPFWKALAWSLAFVLTGVGFWLAGAWVWGVR